MRLIRFFLSTFKGNYAYDSGMIPVMVSTRFGLFLFHNLQQPDEIIQVIVEVQE
jgi:hypothetical protein